MPLGSRTLPSSKAVPWSCTRTAITTATCRLRTAEGVTASLAASSSRDASLLRAASLIGPGTGGHPLSACPVEPDKRALRRPSRQSRAVPENSLCPRLPRPADQAGQTSTESAIIRRDPVVSTASGLVAARPGSGDQPPARGNAGDGGARLQSVDGAA